MGALFRREVLGALRCHGVAIASAAHAGALLLFLIVWGHGVPLWNGLTLLEQQERVQTVLLTALLPWVAVRVAAGERGARLALTSALLARRPSAIVAARVVAVTLLLGVVVASALPVRLLAQQMSGVSAAMAMPTAARLVGLCGLSAASGVGWTIAVGARVPAWVGAGTTTAGLLGAAQWWTGAPRAGGVSVLLAAGLIAWLASRYAGKACCHVRA